MIEREQLQGGEARFAGVVDTLYGRYQWRLLARDELIARLDAHVAQGEFRDDAAAAFNLYTLALYAACSGQEGPERQELAYGELGRLLYTIALRRFGEHSLDTVDETLGEVFEHFAECRAPGAFVAFAIQRLRTLLRRRRGGRLVSLEEHADQLPAHLGAELELALAAELRERVAACRERFLREHRGARLQFEAVWMKFVLDLDDLTIARHLGKQPRQVYVLRCRGLKKLRHEPAWQALAADLGLPPA